MEFLYCIPTVFVIEDRYEVLVWAKENGIIALRVGGDLYYEENAGTLSSEKPYARISVPREALDAARGYTVVYRRAIERKAYFSVMGESEEAAFVFSPLLKRDGIRMYHISDVHYRFDLAKQTLSHRREGLDLLILNGDIGEVEELRHYAEVAAFLGEISEGRLPVVFVRGNHDTRGRLAERYTDFFPSVGKATYYTFTLGPLYGIVLDCGEDKPDANDEYGGVNDFMGFRRRETAFLRRLSPRPDAVTLAISHVCPAQNTRRRGSKFDIENEVYTAWNEELARLGVQVMLSGHIHRTYLLEKNSPASLRPHDYPVVVAAASYRDEDFWGSDLTLSGNRLLVEFTDKEGAVRGRHAIDLLTGEIECEDEE